ncbi:phosphatases II [Apiospora arundinis]|uniref:phosphatidylinositol-3,4,5-trisphosphate 3-phosphatase n=1 Tax=Apiospora arundinis TaxID=335852 RepID=A0ABR2IUG4_9PEZI
MASLLRQIVAGPRSKHPEAGLDLCYVTDNIVATSGPSQTYPQRAYRNPLDRLVEFLDKKHGKDWAIWEFRAEGTGYPDNLVYNRIRHYPWPDHHPPPFRLVPMIMASMRNWLNGNDLDADGVAGEGKQQHEANLLEKVIDTWKGDSKKNPRIVVVHCKAGKGRSGSMACSYLISQCGWKPEEALARFTERRMRPKFGPGVSIPSQLRWIGYVDRWTQGGKKYVDRELEIVEVHVWGLRNGVKLCVEGFVDEGKKIKVFHTFHRNERLVVEGGAPGSTGFMDSIYDMAGYGMSPGTEKEILDEARETDIQNGTNFTGESPSQSPATKTPDTPVAKSPADTPTPVSEAETKPAKTHTPKLISRNMSTHSLKDKMPSRSKSKKLKASATEGTNSPAAAQSGKSAPAEENVDPEPGGQAVIFKPHTPIRLPTSDVNIDLERRNRAPSSMGLTMVTAVAHVWFNAFFEGNGPERDGEPETNGVFEIDWDKMDGIKGSSRKGTRAADRIAVVWRSVVPSEGGEAAGTAAPGGAAAGDEEVIVEPSVGSPVPQMEPADWKGDNAEDPAQDKKLGLRVSSPDSAEVSRASSILGGDDPANKNDNDADSFEGVKSDMPGSNIGGSGSGDAAVEEENRGRPTSKVIDDKKLEAYAEKLPSPNGGEGSSGKGVSK